MSIVLHFADPTHAPRREAFSLGRESITLDEAAHELRLAGATQLRFVERVQVRYENELALLLIDSDGIPNGLPINSFATMVYNRSATWVSGKKSRNLTPVVGPAIFLRYPAVLVDDERAQPQPLPDHVIERAPWPPVGYDDD